MVKQPDDDLFAASTMTFGEHIEELRGCLSRSLFGLMIGFIVGLFVAGQVVDWIQRPLKNALQEHYIGKAIGELDTAYRDEEEGLSPEVERFVNEKRFVFEEIYIETAELDRVGELLTGYHQGDMPEEGEPVPAAATDELPQEEGDAEEAPAASANERETDAENDATERSPESAEPVNPPRSRAEQAAEATILGDPIPAPHPVLIKARVWRPIDTMVRSLNPQEAFMIWLKAALVAGLVLSSPYIFWQIWMFVAAGLYPHEKNYVHIYLPFSIGLFLTGAATAFFFVFQHVLRFLFGFNRMMNIDPDPRISEWLSFVLFLPLGFGIAFQLPLVMLFLQRIGMFTIQAYLSKWRVAVLVIFTIAMLLTPADPVSMLLMAMPLTGLYFLGIALCHWMPRNRSPFGEGYDP